MSRALIAVVTLAAVAACAKPQNDAAAAADTTKAPVAAPGYGTALREHETSPESENTCIRRWS